MFNTFLIRHLVVRGIYKFIWMLQWHRGGFRNLRRWGAQGLPTKKKLGFRWSKKVKTTLISINFWQIFLSVFSNFLLFYVQYKPTDGNFSIFQIYKHFHKRREITLLQQSVTKEKLRKVLLGSITDCFSKAFKGTLMQIWKSGNILVFIW